MPPRLIQQGDRLRHSGKPIPAEMLVAGIALWRETINRWPQAADLIEACRQAENAAMAEARPANRSAFADRNREAQEAGKPGRIIEDATFWMMTDPNEMRGCRSDGSVIEPQWDKVSRSWTAGDADLAALNRQYRETGRVWTVRGRQIVRKS